MVVLYHLIPALFLGLAALSFLFKIHKRSVSAFLTIQMVALSSNAIHYGFYTFSMIIIFAMTLIIFMRAMMKPENDKFIIRTYRGEEKRNFRNKLKES